MSGFRQFLAENKIWWMMPIVIVLLAVGFVIYMNTTSAADDEVHSAFVYDMN